MFVLLLQKKKRKKKKIYDLLLQALKIEISK